MKVEIKFWQERETEKAILATVEGSDCASRHGSYKIWLPKSQIENVKLVNEDKKCFTAIIAEWLFCAKQNDVSDYFGREIYLNYSPAK